MKILAIISQKGGVGKTTLATALAVAATERGKLAAVFDLDEQATASFWGECRGPQPPPVQDVKIALLQRDLAKAQELGADLIILDCPPKHEAAILAAQPADFVLIPTKPALFDIRSMRATLTLMQSIGKRCGVVLTFCPVAGSQVREARRLIEDIGADVAPVDIHNRVAYQRAQEDGRAAQEYEPEGKAAREVKQLYSYIDKSLHGVEKHGVKTKQIRKRA
jgi:chromosome partitioning protein